MLYGIKVYKNVEKRKRRIENSAIGFVGGVIAAFAIMYLWR